jgi:TetR/AcrR family transcriptional repressor of nem operon
MDLQATGKKAEILAHSRDLLRKRGFNAFSHRELAALVGVKSSSVHYHFPTKEAIGLALIEEYRSEVMSGLRALEGRPVEQRLDGFIDMFIQTAENGEQWCLAGMLASDFMTLGAALQREVKDFFDVVERWLTDQISTMCPGSGTAESASLAKTAMAMLEGALLLSRSQGEPSRVVRAGEGLKQLLRHHSRKAA